MSLLWRNVCLQLLPIFWLSCLFLWYWAVCAAYIFWRWVLLSVVSFAIIFSYSEDCLLIFFIVFFAMQKLLSLIKYHLFIFVFISLTLGGGSKRILLWFMSRSVLPMFLSKSFIVSDLTFKSLIHILFIFVCGVR